MTPTEFALLLAHVATPAPCAGYGWRVDEQLALRDRAAAARLAADTDEAWRAAHIALIAAEGQLARLLDVASQPHPPLDDTPWTLELLMTPDDTQLTCGADCGQTDETRFLAWRAEEIDEQICDDCLAVQRDAADADRAGARGWYGG